LPALINDDYFLAIKLTYNAKHYVSSMKLLLSALDRYDKTISDSKLAFKIGEQV